MPLLNYTTTISVDKTLSEITGMLRKAGARAIVQEYDDEGEPSALTFFIKKLEQIMLPFMKTESGQTVYELMVGHQLALPEGRK